MTLAGMASYVSAHTFLRTPSCDNNDILLACEPTGKQAESVSPTAEREIYKNTCHEQCTDRHAAQANISNKFQNANSRMRV